MGILAFGAFCYLGALYTYWFGVSMKMTDHRPNSSGYDLLVWAWVIASLEVLGGTAVLFPNLLPG